MKLRKNVAQLLRHAATLPLFEYFQESLQIWIANFNSYILANKPHEGMQNFFGQIVHMDLALKMKNNRKMRFLYKNPTLRLFDS